MSNEIQYNRNRIKIIGIRILFPYQKYKFYLSIKVNDTPPIKTKTLEFNKDNKCILSQFYDLDISVKKFKSVVFELYDEKFESNFLYQGKSETLQKNPNEDNYNCYLKNSNGEDFAIVYYNFEFYQEDLFQSFIDYAYELKPDFIIWTGDNSPHDTWEGSQEKVIEATKVLRDMLNEKFNYEIPIFPVLGNHEVYPNDLFNVTDGKKDLLLEMADIYKSYLTEEAYETFKEKGYYSMLLPNTNLRLISINCFYCDSWNYYLINSNKSDAKQMLKWLEETLRSSEENNEYVYILNHFPLNADFSLIECARRFIALYDRYEYIIRGIFSGHTHHHDIVPVYSYFNRTKITHLNYVSSSLTTHSHQLPSFSIFNIDSTTFQIKDYDVYIFNMNQSNILLKPIWYKSYTATSLFNVEDMSDVYKIINKDVEGDYIIKEYADSKYGKSVCHKESAIRKAKCVLTTDTFYDFYLCNYPKIFALKQDMFVMILNYFEGPWEVDKE